MARLPVEASKTCNPSNKRRNITISLTSTVLQGIVVMGATNRKDVLDAALTRPGRFDRSIEVRRPDFKGRLECIQVSWLAVLGFLLVCKSSRRFQPAVQPGAQFAVVTSSRTVVICSCSLTHHVC